MRKIKRTLTIALAAFVMLAMSAPMCFAGTGQPYHYRVTISAGEIGVGEFEPIQYNYGQTFDFNPERVYIPDEYEGVYFVKGLRKAGKETLSGGDSGAETYFTDNIKVTKDEDYVVAYGLEATKVKYLVNYQDGNGKTLAPSKTYYGNVGDKPVVAYAYVDGYQPQAYNLTKTLAEDESQNVFTFTYGKVTATDDNDNGGNGAGGNGANGNGAANGNGNGNATVPDGQVPQDLVDLDDGDTPMANVDDGKIAGAKSSSKMPFIIGGGIAVVALAAIAAAVTALRRKGRQDAADLEAWEESRRSQK